MIGDPGPGKGYYGRHAYEEWRRRRPCACGLKECLQSTDSVLFHCGLCTEARALLRNGMSTFASSCDPAYVQARGWQTAVALLRGEPAPGPAEYASARRFLLGLPHAPPLDEKGKPIMGRKHAQRLGRHVYARVLAVFNEAEAGRATASALRPHFPRSALGRGPTQRRTACHCAGGASSRAAGAFPGLYAAAPHCR